jgi:ectoine hydroxylase-related dioxygenase (phytanoyl-CoA dioxygenase family)
MTFLEEFAEFGHALVEDVLDARTIARARRAVETAIVAESEYHGTTDYPDYGTVQCCALYDRVFVEVLDIEALMEPFHSVLGRGCIIYAYLSSSLPPGGTNAAHRIHVDCPRLIPGYPTNMGAVIPLDRFTEDNGATWYLSGSHQQPDPPDRAEFDARADRLIADPGSVWFFNPRLWHSAGVNTTDRWRHSFTLNLCRPYMKQRFDLPRLLADVDLSFASENARQKLGFFAQAPTSLDEYYAPSDQRMFRQPYE